MLGEKKSFSPVFFFHYLRFKKTTMVTWCFPMFFFLRSPQTSSSLEPEVWKRRFWALNAVWTRAVHLDDPKVSERLALAA